MKALIKFHVLGVAPYSVDNNQGGTIWIMDEDQDNTAGTYGVIPTKIGCPYEMVEQFSGVKLPADLEFQVTTRKGANNSTKLFATSFRPAQQKSAA